MKKRERDESIGQMEEGRGEGEKRRIKVRMEERRAVGGEVRKERRSLIEVKYEIKEGKDEGGGKSRGRAWMEVNRKYREKIVVKRGDGRREGQGIEK